MRTNRALGALCAAALLVAACGDDDDAGASPSAYCERSSELNASSDVPSEEELDDLVELAPEEIRDDVRTLVEAVESGEFGEDAATAEAEITAFEEQHCGGDLAAADDGDDGDDGDAPAVVTFLSPTDGDTVSNPVAIEANVVGATIAPAAESGPGEGHYHVMIDTDCLPVGDTIPSDDSHVHFGDGSTTLELPELEPGEHTLCLQLGDADHKAFGAASTITVEVEG